MGKPLSNKEATEGYHWHRRYAIPLDCPAAFSFCMRHLVVPHSLGEMVWAAVSRLAPQVGTASLASRPLFGNGKRRHAAPVAVELSRSLAANASVNGLLAEACERELSWAGVDFSGPLRLLTAEGPRNSPRGQTVAFLFDQREPLPRAVAKIAAATGQGAVLKRECESLRAFATRVNGNFHGALPRTASAFDAGDWTVLLESWLPGPTMYVELRNHWKPLRRAPEHFRAALDLLLEFQQSTVLNPANLDDGTLAEFVFRPLEELQASYSLSLGERLLVANTLKRARQLQGAPLQLAARHGDFWAGNLLLGPDRIGLVDWEHFAWRALPFDDLFFFPTTYGLNFPWKLARWAAPEPAFHATYLEANPIARLVREYLFGYCERTGTPRTLLEVFFPVFLASHAVREKGLTSHEEPAGGTWRRLFRVFAERNEPPCFAD